MAHDRANLNPRAGRRGDADRPVDDTICMDDNLSLEPGLAGDGSVRLAL